MPIAKYENYLMQPLQVLMTWKAALYIRLSKDDGDKQESNSVVYQREILKEHLGAIGIYKPLVDFAGAGATVPLTGFGYNLSKGVKEAIDQDGFIGILTGGLKATAGGITAAITAGLLASLIFKAKDKS